MGSLSTLLDLHRVSLFSELQIRFSRLKLKISFFFFFFFYFCFLELLQPAVPDCRLERRTIVPGVIHLPQRISNCDCAPSRTDEGSRKETESKSQYSRNKTQTRQTPQEFLATCTISQQQLLLLMLLRLDTKHPAVMHITASLSQALHTNSNSLSLSLPSKFHSLLNLSSLNHSHTQILCNQISALPQSFFRMGQSSFKLSKKNWCISSKKTLQQHILGNIKMAKTWNVSKKKERINKQKLILLVLVLVLPQWSK